RGRRSESAALNHPSSNEHCRTSSTIVATSSDFTRSTAASRRKCTLTVTSARRKYGYDQSESRNSGDTVGGALKRSVASSKRTALILKPRGSASLRAKGAALAASVRCDDKRVYVAFDDGREVFKRLPAFLREPSD